MMDVGMTCIVSACSYSDLYWIGFTPPPPPPPPPLKKKNTFILRNSLHTRIYRKSEETQQKFATDIPWHPFAPKTLLLKKNPCTQEFTESQETQAGFCHEHPMAGTLVFPFIPWDVWNWKPSSFSKVGAPPPPPPTNKHPYSEAQCSLSLSLSLSLSFSPHPHLSLSLFCAIWDLHHRIFITSHLWHITVMPTFFQTLDRQRTQLNQKQRIGLAFHFILCFWPFNCCLSLPL